MHLIRDMNNLNDCGLYQILSKATTWRYHDQVIRSVLTLYPESGLCVTYITAKAACGRVLEMVHDMQLCTVVLCNTNISFIEYCQCQFESLKELPSCSSQQK